MEPKKVFLLPCELCFSKEPVEIATLLGSCVAVCLYNWKMNIGGMNHFMLDRTSLNCTPSGKFGDYATETLVQMMLSCDKDLGHVDASVIGGGNVVGHLNIENGIGIRNLAVAIDILKKQNIKIVNSKNVGGDYGRKVYFKSWTGDIDIRRIEKSEQTLSIEEKEKAFMTRKIRVLIVDDSATVRWLISDVISQDPQIEVVGEAENPYVARELLLSQDPDVILLDIVMPKMDGITFLKKLFFYKPKPVIVISTVVQEGSKIREQAKKIGAVDVIDKAELNLYDKTNKVKDLLLAKIKAAAAVYLTKKTAAELENI